jgi:hypothetical protein
MFISIEMLRVICNSLRVTEYLNWKIVVALRAYNPLKLNIWSGGFLMWRSFIVEKEDEKLIESEGLSRSNCDKLIRLVENYGTWSTLLSVIEWLAILKFCEPMWEISRPKLLLIWSLSGPL